MSFTAAAIGATALGAASEFGNSFVNWGVDSWLNQQQQKMALERMANEQQFNALEAQKARDWQEKMASTNYQRAIADMEKAGLNPASLVGTSPSGAMAPSAANASSSASGVPGSSFNSHIGMSNMMSSAIQGMLAKDRDAARYLADEIRDNAKHAYKMEETKEKIMEWKHSRAFLDMVKQTRDYEFKDKLNREYYKHLTDVESYKNSHYHKSYPKF